MKKMIKNVLCSACGLSLMMGLSVKTTANELSVEDIANVPTIEGTIDQPNEEDFQKVVETMQNDFVSTLAEEPEILKKSYSIDENENLQLDMKSRETWLLEDKIFNGTGDVSASDNIDMYIVQTTEDTAPAMKILSSNSNLIVRLYLLDMSTGQASGTNIYDQAGDDNANVLGSMPAGNYVLGIYSLDSSQPAGDYTLMWNCTNPAGASTVVNCDSNLLNVILGYTNPIAIYCNGTEWLHDLEWEEHYTFSFGNSYSGRDQSISDVTVHKVNVGEFNSNKYTTNNALFVEVGINTLWSIMRSQYTNNEGDVTHNMDWTDAIGQKTPRRFTAADLLVGPHYIVIDMNTNQVVDFASPYNYLWLTEQTTGSASFTRENILGQ